MYWILLIVVVLFEVVFADYLRKTKSSIGSKSTLWYIGFLICFAIAMYLLVRVTQEFPIGLLYAVLTGIAAVGIVISGIPVFKQ